MPAEQEYKAASRMLKVGMAAIALLTLPLVIAGPGLLDVLGLPLDAYPIILAAAAFFGGVPLVLLAIRFSRLKARFWKDLASHFGFGYEHRPWFKEEALVFREGHGKRTGHGLIGTIEDHPFRLFEYSYTIGYGKHQRTYSYVVAEITFSGSFPHLYMNNIRNRNLSSLKSFTLPSVTLPLEFEKTFRLYAPKGYEIEALHIFTPDVLAHLLDSGWQHDFELVDQRLYIFREEHIDERADLEGELAAQKAFLAYLAPKLARMQLAPVGDLKTTL